MYTNHFGLRCRPFEDRADPQFLYATSECEELLATMEYEARYGKGMALVLGESGTGKTLLIRALLPRLHTSDQVVVLTWSANSGRELVRETCKAFGVTLPSSYNPERGLARLRGHLRRANKSGHRCVLIIDQAENLTSESLSQLDTISSLHSDDVPLLPTILVGQPRLRTTLDRPEFDGLRQRLFAERVVPPLSANEVQNYIQHRLHVAGAQDADLFDSDAVTLIHQASGGIVRLVNRICDAAMVAAYGSGRPRVGRSIVADVTREQMTREHTADLRDIGMQRTGEWTEGLPGPAHPPPHSMARSDLGRGIARAMNMKPFIGPDGFDDANEIPSSDVDVVPQGPIQDVRGTNVRGAATAEFRAASPTVLDRLERTIAKAERVTAASEASLTRNSAVERQLASLTANADNLTARLTPAVNQATKAFEHVQERIRHLLTEAESRAEAVAASVTRSSESVSETSEQAGFIEKACAQAEHVEARLTTFAEQLADKADQVQARMTELMGGLEASDAAHGKLQTTLDQVRSDCTEAREKLQKKLDHAATVNAESSQRADAQETKLHEVIDRCEQWHQKFAGSAIQEYRKNLEEQFAEMERLQSKSVDAACQSVRDLREEAAALSSEARTAGNAQRGSYGELVSRIETFRKQFVETTVADYRDALQEQLEKYRRLHGEAVESTRRELDELRDQIATVSADASTKLQEQLDTHRQLQDESSQQAENRLASVRRKIASAVSQGDAAVEAAVHKHHTEVEGLLSDSRGQVATVSADALTKLQEQLDAHQQLQDESSQQTEDRLASVRRKISSVVSEGDAAVEAAVDKYHAELADALSDSRARMEDLRRDVSEIAAPVSEIRSSFAKLIDDIGRATDKVGALSDVVTGIGVSTDDLIRRSETAKEQLSEAAEHGERVLPEVLQSFAKLGDDIGKAMDKVGTLSDTVTGIGVSTDDLIRRSETAKEQLSEAAEHGERVLPEVLQSCAKLDALQSSITTMLLDLGSAQERIRALREEAAGAEQVGGRLISERQRGEQTAKQLDDSVQTATQLRDDVHRVAVEVEGKIGQLDSHNAAAQNVLHRLADTNMSAHSLISQANDATHAVNQAAAEAKEGIDRLLKDTRSLTETTDARAGEIGEANQQAVELVAQLESATGPTDQVAQELTARIEDAKGQCKKIAEHSAQATELAERFLPITDALTAAKEVDASICSTLQDARGVHDGLSSLTEAARERKAQLAETNGAAVKLIEMQQALGQESMEVATVLADQLRNSVSTADTGRKLLDEFDRQAKAIEGAIQALRRKTAEIDERITAAVVKPNEIVAAAKEQAAQLEQVCRAVKKVFAGLAQATLDAKKQATECRETGSEAAGRLTTVFAGLAQATLDAKKQTAECRETGSEAAGRLTELRERTEKAAQMLQEWSEEVVRVQARLERTIEDCSSIRQTHSNEVLRAMSTPSRTTPSRTTPKTLPTNEVCPPVPPRTAGASEAPGEEVQTALSPRAAEIAQLIEDAKRASGISDSD